MHACSLLLKASFPLDKSCWVCAKWMLHSTCPVAILVSKQEWRQGSPATVECCNHFGHTQQFLSNAKLTLLLLRMPRPESRYQSNNRARPPLSPLSLMDPLFDKKDDRPAAPP